MGRSPAPSPGRPTVRRGRSLPGVRPARGRDARGGRRRHREGRRESRRGDRRRAARRPRGPTDGHHRARRAARRGAPASTRARDRDHGRRKHEGRGRGGRRGRTACASSAATRWPAARRRATRLPPADLFVDRPWVVVPTDPDDLPAVVAVETLAVACRARPIRMDAATHDLAVAAISHLPLVIAAALVEAVAGPDADGPRRRAGRWHARSPRPAGAT